jgi:hypothetical protein
VSHVLRESNPRSILWQFCQVRSGRVSEGRSRVVAPCPEARQDPT